MRKAAGIILIILGVVLMVELIYRGVMSSSIIPSSYFLSNLWGVVSRVIVYGGLLVAGGFLCLKRRYWGLCLVSALLTLFFQIIPVVGQLLRGPLYTTWVTWILIPGALIATIFISRTKKEWQEISDSVDGKVSYGG